MTTTDPAQYHSFTLNERTGLCHCGKARLTTMHPHEAAPVRNDPKMCVCGTPCAQHPDYSPEVRRGA